MNVDIACGSCGKHLDVPEGVKLGALACPACGSKNFSPASVQGETAPPATGYLAKWRGGAVAITLSAGIVGGLLVAFDMPGVAAGVAGVASILVAVWTFCAVSTWMMDVLYALRSHR